MKRLTLICSGVLLLLVATRAVSVRSSATISVQNADNFATKQIALPNPLSSLVSSIADRIVHQFSDFKHEMLLAAPPAPFSGYLNNIGERIVKQYADDERKLTIAAVPAPLDSYLGRIPDRVVMLYVDQSRSLSLGYPKELLGDKTPPAPPAEPPIASPSENSITISWTTDEFTTFVIEIGTSSGVYTIAVTGSEFGKTHQVTIEELPTAETYYYQIVSSDLSGNRSTSPEYTIEAESLNSLPVIYLPLITR